MKIASKVAQILRRRRDAEAEPHEMTDVRRIRGVAADGSTKGGDNLMRNHFAKNFPRCNSDRNHLGFV
jgi:hypothetical protein